MTQKSLTASEVLTRMNKGLEVLKKVKRRKNTYLDHIMRMFNQRL